MLGVTRLLINFLATTWRPMSRWAGRVAFNGTQVPAATGAAVRGEEFRVSLLGMPLIVVLAAAAVVLPILTAWVWARQSSRYVAAGVGRFGLVVASQLAAVLLVAALANDYGYFYGTWTGLWRGVAQAVTGSSNGPLTMHTIRRGTTSAHLAGTLAAANDPRFSTPAQWPTRGRLESAVIHGGITQLRASAHIFLPPQYFQPRYAHTLFPALEVFTGYPGSNRQLTEKLKYQHFLLRDLHHHTARPMVLVMMRSSPVMPRDAECTDVPGGPQVQTFFAQDVPREITTHYRVQPDGWGAIGDSTGGYCAAKVTMLNPATFRAAASLSGYFTTLHDNTTGSLWGGSRVLRDLNDLDWRMRHMPAPPVSLLVTTSRDEVGPLGIGNSRRFLSLVRPPLRASAIIEPHGGHNFTTWVPEIAKALSWLSARLPAPRRG